MPLAVLLSHMAAAKYPGLARLLGQALYQAGEREASTRVLEPFRITSGPGSTRYDQATDSYIIMGIGANIRELADEFHFAFKTLRGGGSITAWIDNIANTRPGAKAGVMIRTSPDSDAANAFCRLGARQDKAFLARREIGAVRRAPATGFATPYWIR